MSTDPSTENQDLPTNIDNAPDNPDATLEEKTGSLSGNLDNSDSRKHNEDDQQHQSLASSQVGDNQGSTTQLEDSYSLETKTDLVEIFGDDDPSQTNQHEPTNFSQIEDNRDSTTELENPNNSLSRANLTPPSQFKVELDKIFEYVNNKLRLLSKNNIQLDEKMERVLKENTKLHLDLTEENKQLRLEVTSLNERLAKLEESAKFKFDGLVKDAIRQDDEVWDEDNEECQKYIAQSKLWHSKTETLCTSVLTAISDCVSRFDQCGGLMQEINKENETLHNSLLDRYKSLELSKKMLERLREPLDLLKKASLPSEQLLRLQEQELVDLLRSQTDESEAKKILTKKVKETGDTRYKAVREWRDLAEKSQKQWLNFIEKKLLPALDGINEGNRYAEHLASDLINSYKIQSYQEKISAWLQTYKDLEDILLGALKSQDVTPMIVVRSQPVDYNLHEPIGTEPDANLPHESVKEITRNGYEYKLPDREQSLILRSAQIIVVKNK
jgi:molecular chaperone GrpE (heat shock protein)